MSLVYRPNCTLLSIQGRTQTDLLRLLFFWTLLCSCWTLNSNIHVLFSLKWWFSWSCQFINWSWFLLWLTRTSIFKEHWCNWWRSPKSILFIPVSRNRDNAVVALWYCRRCRSNAVVVTWYYLDTALVTPSWQCRFSAVTPSGRHRPRFTTAVPCPDIPRHYTGTPTVTPVSPRFTPALPRFEIRPGKSRQFNTELNCQELSAVVTGLPRPRYGTPRHSPAFPTPSRTPPPRYSPVSPRFLPGWCRDSAGTQIRGGGTGALVLRPIAYCNISDTI